MATAEQKGQTPQFQLPVEIPGSELEAGIPSASTVSDGERTPSEPSDVLFQEVGTGFRGQTAG